MHLLEYEKDDSARSRFKIDASKQKKWQRRLKLASVGINVYHLQSIKGWKTRFSALPIICFDH